MEDIKKYITEMFTHRGFTNITIMQDRATTGIDVIMDGVVNNLPAKCAIDVRHFNKEVIDKAAVQHFHRAMLRTIKYPGPKQGFIVTKGTFTQEAIDYGNEINKIHANLKLTFVAGQVLADYENNMEIKKSAEVKAAAEAKRLEDINTLDASYKLEIAKLKKQIVAERKSIQEREQKLNEDRQSLEKRIADFNKEEQQRLENANIQIHKLYHKSLGQHLLIVLKDDIRYTKYRSKLHPSDYKMVILLIILAILAVIFLR